MLSIQVIILEYVCPGLGVIMGNIMFSAPYKDVQKAVANGTLGHELNPLPWIMMLGNCCGWVTYSILKQNLWIFFGNCPGFILSIYLNLCAVKLLYKQEQVKDRSVLPRSHEQQEQATPSLVAKNPKSINQKNEELSATINIGEDGPSEMTTSLAAATTKQSLTAPTLETGKEASSSSSTTRLSVQQYERMIMIMVIIWVACISVVAFGDEAFTAKTREYIIGIVVNLNLVFFYGAPLSTIFTVLKTKNSVSIHIWTMTTNTFNGTFWFAYGLAVLDPFIYVPNGLGSLLGVIQIILCMIFPRRNQEEKENFDESKIPIVELNDNANTDTSPETVAQV